MFKFLIIMNKKITKKSPGSCTENRFTFSQGLNDTSWDNKVEKLLDLCHSFYSENDICSRQDNIFNVASQVMKKLCSDEFKGVGGMGANNFIHLSAATGFIPLCFYNYATLKSTDLGPAKLIIEGYKGNKKVKSKRNLAFCFKIFLDIFKDLRRIWGGLVTLAILENLFCELFRCFKRTTRTMSSTDEMN